MPHSQNATILKNSLLNYDLPVECIDHIMSYSNAKNYYTIYQQCLREVVGYVRDTIFLYHLEQVSNIDTVANRNKDKSVYMVIRRLQFNTEYLRRVQRNDENKDLSPIELIFYLALTADSERVTDVVITKNVFTIPFTCYPKHEIIPYRRKRKM